MKNLKPFESFQNEFKTTKSFQEYMQHCVALLKHMSDPIQSSMMCRSIIDPIYLAGKEAGFDIKYVHAKINDEDHVLIKNNDVLWDFTYRQFDPHSQWPLVITTSEIFNYYNSIKIENNITYDMLDDKEFYSTLKKWLMS